MGYLGLILLLGLGIRLLFILTPPLDSDQAITGLMARHILGGEFPFFFYGQDYCGSIEAYLVSSLFFFFGSSRFTLDLTICLESLFFIIFIYFLARAIFNEKIALLSALFSALGSYYLIFHSVLARAAYIEIPIIGVLIFILAHTILYRNQSQGRLFLTLGLLSGLGIWTHFLVVFYFPPVFLLLFIKDKWFWARRTFLFFLLGLLLGGLPLWVHNTAQPLVTWHYLMGTAGSHQSVLNSFKDFFLPRFPEALGIMNNADQTFFIPFYSLVMYLVYLGVFLFQFLSRRNGFLGLSKLRLGQSNGFDLLLLFLLLYPFIFSLSGFASAHTTRYLQPLFTVLPILMAAFTGHLISGSLALASLFLMLHLFSNGYGILSQLPLISENQLSRFRQARQNDQVLFAFLKEKKIRHVYSLDYWRSVQLTFDAREEIIFAQPLGDRYPQYSALIDNTPRPAFLLAGENRDFETTLATIGGTYQKSLVSGYSIYHHFAPPPYRFVPLDSGNFKVLTNVNPESAGNILDGNIATCWTSNTPQKPGQVLEIDLGKNLPDLGRITLLAGKPEHVPRGLRLEISQDGRTWQTVQETPRAWGFLHWSGPHPFYRPQEGRIDLTFTPRSGRFIRLTQLGTEPTYPWAIAECFIYQGIPTGDLPQYDDPIPLLSYLKGFQRDHIYASPWVRSQLRRDRSTKVQNSELQEEKENLIADLSNRALVTDSGKAPAIAAFFKKRFSMAFNQKEIGTQVVFSFPPVAPETRPLPKKDWRFQTNYNPRKASLAGDGKLTTRWTSETPQATGIFFQVDLGKMKKVSRIRLLLGDSRNDFPRGYLVQTSADGRDWSSLDQPLNPLPLHWTGETILQGSGDLDLRFSPTPMRYLKIVQTGKDPVFYWSIHEIEVFE